MQCETDGNTSQTDRVQCETSVCCPRASTLTPEGLKQRLMVPGAAGSPLWCRQVFAGECSSNKLLMTCTCRSSPFITSLAKLKQSQVQPDDPTAGELGHVCPKVCAAVLLQPPCATRWIL